MKSFDDVLKDDPKEPEATEPQAPEAPEPPKAEEPKEPPKESKVEEGAPTAPETEPKHVPLAALEDERRKRQEIQRELEALRSKPADKAIDPVVDPEGFRKHFEEQSQKALVNERLNMSEQIVRSHLGDEAVDAAMQAFEEAEKSNPGLRATILASRHPYQSLVEWHKREQTLATVGTDLTAYEQRLREKWLEEVKANPAALGLAVPTPQQPVAPSLANRPSVGARDSWTGPTPLGDILKS